MDQGHNFESDLLKALHEIGQVKKIQTSGYHPSTNGQCKHFNVTLINMLGTLPKKPKITWREQVPTLVHTYNCTRNNATGFSPYCLTFGCKPHSPVDLIFRTNVADLKGSSITYIENFKKEWPGHTKLQMTLLRRNRKGTNDIMTARSDE